MSQENRQIFRRIALEVLNEGKLDVIDEVIAADMDDHQPPPPGYPAGLEGFRQFVVDFRRAFPDLHYDVVTEMDQDDLVANVVQASGTMRGEMAGMPATNQRASWTEIHVGRISGGKVVEHWGVVDQFSMMMQLGLAPAPAGAPS